MATTSTNKQPLLVDRVFHEVVSTISAYNKGMDIQGTNAATLLLNCIGSDGAIIEDIYCISRSEDTEYTLNLYLSSNNDYLRRTEAHFIGSVKSAVVLRDVTEFEMPLVLTPVPHDGVNTKNNALYVPANKALWVAREGDTDAADAPLIAAQGGYY